MKIKYSDIFQQDDSINKLIQQLERLISTYESNFEYETIYQTDSEGNKIPYVVKKIEPEIQGITVVAQGGGNAVVQKNISDVLEALFHIEAHKIKVVKMK